MKKLIALILLTSCSSYTVKDVIPSEKNCGYVLSNGKKTVFQTGPCDLEKGDKVKID